MSSFFSVFHSSFINGCIFPTTNKVIVLVFTMAYSVNENSLRRTEEIATPFIFNRLRLTFGANNLIVLHYNRVMTMVMRVENTITTLSWELVFFVCNESRQFSTVSLQYFKIVCHCHHSLCSFIISF